MNRLDFLKRCGAALTLAASGAAPALGKETVAPDFFVFDFPKEVKKTIIDFVRDGTLMEISKKRRGRHDWVYSAKYVRKGQVLTITTAENGRLVKIEGDEPEKKTVKATKHEAKPHPKPTAADPQDKAKVSNTPAATETTAPRSQPVDLWDSMQPDDSESYYDDESMVEQLEFMMEDDDSEEMEENGDEGDEDEGEDEGEEEGRGR